MEEPTKAEKEEYERQENQMIEEEMSKESSLSDKRQDRKYSKPTYNTRYTYSEEDVREAVKRTERRLKEELGSRYYSDKAIERIKKVIDKIFLEEFGEKLT